MEVVHVVDVNLRHDGRLEQLAAVWCRGHVLEAKEARLLRILDHDDHVLDTHAELTGFVVSGLIADAHTLGERNSKVPIDTDRTLVNAEASAHTVARAMLIFQTCFEEMSSREDVHVGSAVAGIHRPGAALDVQVAHKNASVAIFLEVSGLGEVHSSGDVSRTVEILGAGVEQIHLLVTQLQRGLLDGEIVNDGTVRADRGDRAEARLNKQFIRLLEFLKLPRTLVFGDFMIRFLELLL